VPVAFNGNSLTGKKSRLPVKQQEIWPCLC